MNLVSDFYRDREGLRSLLRELASDPGERMLDVGCQRGDVTRTWSRPRTRIVAIDIQAWPEWNAPEPGISFVRASATRLPFADESFDLVVAAESLQYVDDRMAALEEAGRVLRPGGRMILSFPEGSPWNDFLDPYNWVPQVKRVLQPGRPQSRFIRYPRARDVLARCRARGLELVAHHRRGSLVFIYTAALIDRLQNLRTFLIRHRLRWLAEAVAGIPIRALFLLMRLDFAIPYGPLAYNNALVLRKTLDERARPEGQPLASVPSS